MLILVEGADGSGKSELVKQLNKLGFKTMLAPDRNGDARKIQWERLCLEYDNLVVERSFISELVYRTFDTETPAFTLQDIVRWIPYCKVIYCETSRQFDDSMARGETNIVTRSDNDELCNLYRFYLKMFEQFAGTKVFFYDWYVQNIYDVVEFIGGKNGIR